MNPSVLDGRPGAPGPGGRPVAGRAGRPAPSSARRPVDPPGRHAAMAPVAVVGGGLAGITAALALGEAGLPVTLYEARPRLGGATHSFERDGLVVDNGQHVFLRCCTAYRGLLDRLGGTDRVRLQDRFDLRVLTPAGRPGRLRRATLPGPLHLMPALAAYSLLRPADRMRAVRCALALRRLDPAGPELDGIALGDWLAAHGQRDTARRALWELFAVAALNIGVEEAALGPAAMVFRTALLGRADAADIGVPVVPLGDLHGTAATAAIEKRGGRVRPAAKVTAIEPGPVVVVDGERIDAAAVIVATPHRQAAHLVPWDAAPDRQRWAGLGESPIVNVHLHYDRPVTDLPFAAVVDSPVQWIFDRTRPSGARTGQYLAVSVSAADRWIDEPAAKLRAEFVPAMEQLFPAARHAGLRDFFVTRERRATFRQAPGSGALRPGPDTRWPGLYLAGSWTDTGWPDTMEGAVRSGLTAARLVRSRLTGSAS
ncbi:hydroxysqualene dehydroxylase HpnE [Actinoallomurus soli]|uniref:hydroxysqualene dehydroxylase HpnE n=1 Tax=Actinoallomurus soli TaxID=2952535 RepID=UPI0020929599|nr:hydroxysqualene dehydroxylase HpnE [Actinoallomurus soli]MCO5967559.1 hydroxysqualene dehydroxylase HpnE [Actinoallomurus soli]